ncbi:hypothetical protein VPHD148_0299 [Vibrio phage D148]
MLAPQLTQEWFDECRTRGLSAHKAISKLNAVNCRAAFSTTIPKALREDERWNAYLIIKNHRNRYKYIGFRVQEVAGRIKIVTNPEFIWTGYVHYDGKWYGVHANDLIKGVIPKTSKIILPEIEHASESNT